MPHGPNHTRPSQVELRGEQLVVAATRRLGASRHGNLAGVEILSEAWTNPLVGIARRNPSIHVAVHALARRYDRHYPFPIFDTETSAGAIVNGARFANLATAWHFDNGTLPIYDESVQAAYGLPDPERIAAEVYRTGGGPDFSLSAHNQRALDRVVEGPFWDQKKAITPLMSDPEAWRKGAGLVISMVSYAAHLDVQRAQEQLRAFDDTVDGPGTFFADVTPADFAA